MGSKRDSPAVSLSIGLTAGLAGSSRATFELSTASAVEPAVKVRSILVGAEDGSYAWMMPHEGVAAIERVPGASTPRSRDLAALSQTAATRAAAERDEIGLAFSAGLALGAAGVTDGSRARVLRLALQTTTSFSPTVASALEAAADRSELDDDCADCLAAAFRACATTGIDRSGRS